MKRLAVFFMAVFLLCIDTFGQRKVEKELAQLYAQYQFVQMEERCNQYNKEPSYYLYKALYANVSNKPGLSNRYLDSLSDKRLKNSFQYWKLRNDNWIKLFDYTNALHTSKKMTDLFRSDFDSIAFVEELNAQRIWEALAHQPPQAIDTFRQVTVATQKDLAGLINVGVQANGTDTDFVFDTGAGISCITESMAKKMGIVFMPDNQVEVMSFTGVPNRVRIGMMPKISIGPLVVYNTPFLIYPDSAFTFAGGAYVINGIIGFPVAKELGTITIEGQTMTFGRLQYPHPKPKNLFLDQLRPVLTMSYRGKLLPFNVDSGAQQSTCYRSFYDMFGEEIRRSGRLITEKSAGAGGQEVSVELYELQNISFVLGSKTVSFERLKIDFKQYSTYGKNNFGNIGQDLFRQYKKVIISFDHNYLALED